jgi:hypothetical protein
MKVRKLRTLKRWTENAALRMTNRRFAEIDHLLREVAYLWGDQDEYAVGLSEQLIKLAEETKLEIIVSVQTRAEEREEVA